MYLHRHIEPILLEAVTQFPIVAILGARQVGKSTLLKKLFADSYAYLSFDDLNLRTEAKKDPALFLKNFPGRLILDEIQYVPELLSEIKRKIDEHREPGLYLLTGSLQFHLVKGLQDALPGRILLLQLNPMTVLEKLQLGTDSTPWLMQALACASPNLNAVHDNEYHQAAADCSPVQELHVGGIPPHRFLSEKFRPAFFDSYIQTYLLRDLSSLIPETDPTQILRFLRLLAPLSGRELNKAQVGRELSFSPPTANRWLDRLEQSFLWAETPAYFSNYLKRISKHPRGYLFDTGLICSLLGIPDAETLTVHPLIGQVFETALRIEIRSLLQAYLIPAQMYHWRTYQGREVDIVLEYKNRLYAFECKWGSSVSERDLLGLKHFKTQYKEAVALCAILTPTGYFQQIAQGIYQIPWIPK